MQSTGSALQELKALGLASDVWVGTDQCTTNGNVFSVTVVVTELGLQRWEDVVQVFVQLIRMMRFVRCRH